MVPSGFRRPRFINDISNPATFIVFLIIITIGVCLVIYTWFC